MTTTDEKIAEILGHLTALREGQTSIQEYLREHDRRFALIETQIADLRRSLKQGPGHA